MGSNERAFLDMLAWSEGTAGHGNDGYNVLVGGALFYRYDKHPGISVRLPRVGRDPLYSTAAGRYQFKKDTWDDLQRKLKLPDFGPISQDLAALELVKERHALEDVQAGRVQAAITKCSGIWASLPGNDYGQHQQRLSDLMARYVAAGGKVA